MSFLGHSVLKNIATLKSRSRVNQGNWKWYHSIDCMWFPYSNFVPKTHRFSDIRLVSACTVTLKPGLGVTRGHRNRHVWNRSATCTGLSPTVSEIKCDFSPKSQTAVCILHPRWRDPPGIGYQRLGSKTRIMGLPGRERCLMISSAVWIQYSTRTWRTDGRTRADSKDHANAWRRAVKTFAQHHYTRLWHHSKAIYGWTYSADCWVRVWHSAKPNQTTCFNV